MKKMRHHVVYSTGIRHFCQWSGCALLLIFGASAQAQTWKNTANGNWSTATNWVGNTVPTSSASTALIFDANLLTAHTATDNLGASNSTFLLNSLTFQPAVLSTITIAAAGTRSIKFTGTAPSITTTSVGLGQQVLTISAPVILGTTTTVTNPGVVTIGIPTGGTTFTGGVSGTGGLTIKGLATFNTTQATYSGTTTLGNSGNGAVSESSSDVLSHNSSFQIQSGSTLYVFQNQTIGGLSGTGTVEARASLTSPTNTLSVGSGDVSSTFDGTLKNLSNFNTLALTKIGNGTLTLTGNNTYSGGTTINAGTLAVGSSSALGTGDVNLTSGTLSTNGVQTTINVSGAYNQTGGTLALSLLGATNNDNEQLVVTGGSSSTLGDNLTINGNGLTVTPNLQYDLATFTNGYTGQFSSTTINDLTLPAGFFSVLDYQSNDVLITFFQSLQTVMGLTPNQQSVATYINQFAPNSIFMGGNIGGNFNTLVSNIYPLTTDPAALGSALDQISPQSLQVWRHIAFDNATFANQQLGNHLANLRDGQTGFDGSQLTYSDPTMGPALTQIKSHLLAWTPPPSHGLVSDTVNPVMAGVAVDPKDMRCPNCAPDRINSWSTFIAGDVILADLSHDPDMAHQDYTSSSITAGADYHINKQWTVGALFSYGHTDATLDHIGSSSTVDSYSPGIYASYVDGGWYGNGLFSYGYNSYTENRNIQIGALNGTNTGAPQGNQYVGNLTGGYEFKRGAWKFGPTASAQYVNLGINSFIEEGPTALNVQSQSDESFRSLLGFEARYAGHVQGWFGSFDLTPHVSLQWQHEYLDDSRGITSQFNQLGTGSFTVQTTETDRDSAFIDAGLDAQIEDNITLFIDYQTQAGQSDFFAQSIQGGLKAEF